MNEELNILRTDDGGLLITLTTTLADEGHLVIRRKLPRSPNLGQMQILELQADLMDRALVLLQQKLQAARRIDRQQTKPT